MAFAVMLSPLCADTVAATDTQTTQTVVDSTNVALLESTVKSTKLVATKTLRINWTCSEGADGYIVYRLQKGNSEWKKIATLKGENQLYCYDSSVSAKKVYYYKVKAYATVNEEKVYAPLTEGNEFKAYYKSVTINPKKGNFSKGSVYGPYLTTKQLSQVKSAVKSFHKKYITSDMTDVEKALVAQLYLARYCTYASDYSKNGANSAWGALVYKNKNGLHEAQCSGYARAYKALCDSMGVTCRYVHANTKSLNPSHQWNEVKIDGKWYIVDPQCNANSGFLVFFLVGSDTYKGTGMRWNTSKYPKVAANDYSYTKIEKAGNSYKTTRAYNKIFK